MTQKTSKTSSSDETQRLGLTFHRDFWLKTDGLRQLLELVAIKTQQEGDSFTLSISEIQANTGLGTIYAEAYPRWARAAGLLTAKNHFTPFGEMVRRYDPLLDMNATQWLIHYHLCAPKGYSPEFWPEIVLSRFRSGDTFSQAELQNQIGEIYARVDGKVPKPENTKSAANIFLETYVQPLGLGRLGVLCETGKNTYEVLEPDTPPTWTIAAAVLHLWRSLYNDRVTVNLKDLNSESGLANIFMISRSRLELILGEMQEAGVVELFRIAPPYQVALHKPEIIPALERMYTYDRGD